MTGKQVAEFVKNSVWIIVLMLMIYPILTEAQNSKRTKVWYFGDHAGLDFNSGHPVAITDGAMSALEGTSVISDLSGNLLFYTNGGDLPYNGGIWNRSHQLMPNGDLSSANGCNSSFQSSLILPHPRFENLYYLFTTDCIENNSEGGLRYSIIDMALDGGMGDVIVKDVLLTTPVDESLTAVKHANDQDYWLIAHKIHTDSFYVYHLTSWGITGVVKSKIGPVTPDYAGALKTSTNGQKLVYSGLTFTALFDFDKETGIISNHIDLGIPSYSAAFSPNCELLYIADGTNKSLYQFDVTKHDIPSTGIKIGTTSSTGFGALQLGPNGRIYAARFVTSSYLGVITRPNIRGYHCNYIDDGVYLAGKFSKGGLPNFSNEMLGECLPYREENISTHQFDLQRKLVGSHQFMLDFGSTQSQSISYKVFFRELEESGWNEYISSTGKISFNDLTPATTYHVKVLPMMKNHPNYEFIKSHFTEDIISNKSATQPANQIQVTTLDEFDFELYPNPATSSSTISVSLGEQPSTLDIVIMQANGKILKEYNYDNVSGSKHFSIDTKELTNGIYHVGVQSQESYVIKKLIVMK